MTTSAASHRHRHALPMGQIVGRYELKDQLGYGSFGITYLARDTSLNRLVAIKELLPTMIASRYDTVLVDANSSADLPQWRWAQQRFVEEAQALARCEHPNVLHVYETFQENGTAYMVTRYEEGCNFHQWLERLGRPMTQGELDKMLGTLLSALKCVHAQGFYHRDIKPENIYLTRAGTPILIDFGSAREAVTSRSVPVTAIVTEGYAPFEQYSMHGAQGPWIDLYALGAVMYTAITREVPPFATLRTVPGEDPYQSLAARYSQAYQRRFLQLIDAALCPDPRRRPQSAAEWERLLGSSGPPPLPPTPPVLPVGPAIFPDPRRRPQSAAEWERLLGSSGPPPLPPTPPVSPVGPAITSATLVWPEGQTTSHPLGEVRPAALAPNAALAIAPVSWSGLAATVHCQTCHQPFPADAVVEIAGARVCAACKPIHLQRMLQRIRQGQHSVPGLVWRKGKDAIVQVGAELPDRCVKCNGTTELSRLKQGTLRFSLCAEHRGARRLKITLSLLCLLAACAGIPLFAVYRLPDLCWIVPLLLLVAAGVFAFQSQLVWAGKFDISHLLISGCDESFLAALPRWPGGSSQ